MDTAQLPGSNFEQLAINAGLISLASDGTGTGVWYPAVSLNKEVAGSLAEPNYTSGNGTYIGFWSSVTTAHPSATLSDVVGSSGVDTNTNTTTDPNANTAWAVVNQSANEYAVALQVFTEQVFTITVN